MGDDAAEKVKAQKQEIKDHFAKEERSEDLKEIQFKQEPLDDTLQRFLQARKFNVAAAIEQMKNAIAWRRKVAKTCVELGKAACLGADIEEVTQFYRGAYAGHCKIGRPIWYEQTGRVDIHSLHCLTSDENFIKYHVCLMEELQDKYAEATKKYGKTCNKTLSILDLKEVTMAKLSSETLEFVKKISKVDSDNYPETMGKMFVINAPGLFTFAWGIIKGFLDPRTVSKIELLGGPEVWKPRLLEFVEIDQLPAELGGTGPACLPDHKAFEETSLASGSNVETSFPVQAGDKLKYKFFTRSGSISHKIVFKPTAASDPIDLIPLKAYTGDQCSEGKNVSGIVEAPGAGTVSSVWEHPDWWGRELLHRFVKLDVSKATTAATAPDSAPAPDPAPAPAPAAPTAGAP